MAAEIVAVVVEGEPRNPHDRSYPMDLDLNFQFDWLENCYQLRSRPLVERVG